MLEILVALTLLGGVLTAATPLVVRHGRLLASYREYQLALEELSNQLDRLTALPAAELPQAVEHLTPSTFAAERLPGVELKAELEPAEFGQRLTLRLTWDEPQRRAAPVCLTTWIVPASTQGGVSPREDGR